MRRLNLLGLLVLVMVASTIMVACGNGNNSKEINFTVGFEHMYIGSGENHDLEAIVRTLAEWNTLVSARSYLSEMNEKYNAEFFIENSLIVFAFTSGYSPADVEVDNLARDGNGLILEATNSPGDIAVVSKGIIVLEVKRSDIQGANTLRVVWS